MAERRPEISATDETTPLLAASSAGPTTQANEESLVKHASNVTPEDEDKPLPMGQIAILCYARLIEPIAFFSIFPFINQMIRDTGNLDERDVGFYSGLIESLFSLTQMCLMIQWGRLSDRVGRKPVLVFSLVGVSVAVSLFGFAKEIWQMILFRCLAGVFSGTIVTVRTMISENSTPKTQARAFSLFAFSGNVGIFFGSFLGGALADPASQFPETFGHVRFFQKYPYATPTIVVGIMGLTSAIVIALFLKETLVRKEDTEGHTKLPMTTWEVIKAPGVAIVLAIYGSVMLTALANTAVSPVFMFTSVLRGGYGFSPLYISMFIALAGFSQSFWTLAVFPPLHKRIGTRGILRVTSAMLPFLFLTSPINNQLLKHNQTTAFWITAPVMMLLGGFYSQAFTSVQLAVNDITPTPAALGTLNGIALTLVAGIRAIAPALFASLFAFGARTQILGGYLIWLIMIIMAIVVFIIVLYLPPKAHGIVKETSEEVDEDA